MKTQNAEQKLNQLKALNGVKLTEERLRIVGSDLFEGIPKNASPSARKAISTDRHNQFMELIRSPKVAPEKWAAETLKNLGVDRTKTLVRVILAGLNSPSIFKGEVVNKNITFSLLYFSLILLQTFIPGVKYSIINAPGYIFFINCIASELIRIRFI
jgi:hypothetical protein